MKEWLRQTLGTKWTGQGELWLDPAGNSATIYNCTLSVDESSITYTWQFEDEEKQGHFAIIDNGIEWFDSWHQTASVLCTQDKSASGIFSIRHEYSVDGSPNWGWRTILSERPDGSLVLQMTNIAPWGEEGRAVRMVFGKT